MIKRLFLLAFCFACLTACAGLHTSEQLWDGLLQKARTEGFRAATFTTSRFTLAALLKGNLGDSQTLVVYLEGDGRGVVRGRVSHDPTPHVAMGYELARFDPALSVMYLARIGQFQPSNTGPAYQAYWSEKRLADEAVHAANEALDQAKLRLGASHLHLIGYSGGGGLALLLAARRTDVLSITTVAGLLDIAWWVKEGQYQPLVGSLNPADELFVVARLPQVHFFGIHDIIIPPAMSAHFQSLVFFTDFQRVPVNTNHWDAWTEVWPDLLKTYLLPLRATASTRKKGE